jgi:hypothetical protein
VAAGAEPGRFRLDLAPAKGVAMQLDVQIQDGRTAAPVAMETRLQHREQAIRARADASGLVLSLPDSQGAEQQFRYDPATRRLVGGNQGETSEENSRLALELRLLAGEVSGYWRQVSRTQLQLRNAELTFTPPGAPARTFRRVEPQPEQP